MNEWMYADELIEEYMERYACDQNEATKIMVEHINDALKDTERWVG
jgi:hypothetical protein